MADKETKEQPWAPLWDIINEKLREHGVDLDVQCCSEDEGSPRMRVVCVANDLKSSLREMGKAPRDQVVMVRVDEETCKKLDSWVESGAVKSRSEAAALFIREGLKVRGAELDQLEDALHDLEKAKSRLRAKASQIFDAGGGEDDGKPG